MASMAKWLTSKLGGAFNQNDNLDMLSNGATKLIEDALEGFETSEPIVDYNAWVVGTGTSGAGHYVHSSVSSTASVWKHPLAQVKMKLLESAANIKDQSNWDTEYSTRLLGLKTAIMKSHGAVWGRQCLHGLDQFHDLAGRPVPENTSLYVPNSAVYEIAQDHPSHFVPCVSIHPYKRGAVDELRRWIKRGVKVVKWIPSLQGIDPANEKCDKFYTLMAQHGIILHSGGDRVLIEPPGFDLSLENPLLLRRPLSFGVKVVVSHCASEGKSLDLEIPPHALVDNLFLFLRMMDDPKYVGQLFGDISGICNFTRVECLLPLLDNPDLHKRLVYGSDYPIPAINLVVQTYWFGNKGLISEKDCDLLGEIYKVNPLLFDFVVKRTLKSKKGNKFNISVFKEHPDLKISKIDLVDHLTDDDTSAPPTPEIHTSPAPTTHTALSVPSGLSSLPSPLPTGTSGGNDGKSGNSGKPNETNNNDNTGNNTNNTNNNSNSNNSNSNNSNNNNSNNNNSNKMISSSPSSASPFTASPKFSITTPPSPAVTADPDRPNVPPFHQHHGDSEDEDYTEEVNLTD